MTAAFLASLYAGVADWYVELRPMTKPSAFLPLPLAPEAVTDYLAALTPRDLPYFGVAIRREPTHGRTDNCAGITAVWADIDFKTHPESQFVTAMGAMVYKPSIVVATGGGVHCYWLLTTPLLDPVRAAALLSAWGATVPLSDPVFDLARVLRLPGTVNYKYQPPRRSELWIHEPTRRYDADDLLAHAQQLAVSRGESVPEAGVIAPAFRLPESAGQGDRHRMVYRFLRSMQSRYGLSWDETWAVLRVVNARRCAPPIPEAELRRYAYRAFHSPDRPEFRRLQEVVVEDHDAREIVDTDEIVEEVFDDPVVTEL